MKTLVEYVRQCLRRTSKSLDDEIEVVCEACLSDLRIAGVNVEYMGDWQAEIRQACQLYAKAYFGFHDESDKYNKMYERYKCTLASSGKFGVHTGNDNGMEGCKRCSSMTTE